MKKSTSIALIIIGSVLLAIAFVLFCIHILMLGSVIGKTPAEVHELADQPGLIGYLAGHLSVYGMLFVFPLFVSLPSGTAVLVLGCVFRKKAIKKAEEEKPYIHGIDK